MHTGSHRWAGSADGVRVDVARVDGPRVDGVRVDGRDTDGGHQAGDPLPGDDVPDNLLAVVACLAEALSSGDPQTALSYATSLLAAGLSVIGLYDRVFVPLMADVGTRWQLGRLSVGQEHVYSATLRMVIAKLGAIPVLSTTRGRVVLTAAPGEQHVIGLEMLRHVLRVHGWNVSMPDPLRPDDLVEYVRTLGDVDALGVSVHSPRRATALRDWIARCREQVPGLPVMVGGLGVHQDPELWRRVGAVGGADTLTGALTLVEQLTNPLTPKERQVLVLASAGHTNEEVAGALGIKATTVKTHFERIYGKTGARDRASSVALALRQRWID